MAVIHISRAEAANDFDGLIARAGMGDEIIIGDASPVVLKRAVRQRQDAFCQRSLPQPKLVVLVPHWTKILAATSKTSSTVLGNR